MQKCAACSGKSYFKNLCTVPEPAVVDDVSNSESLWIKLILHFSRLKKCSVIAAQQNAVMKSKKSYNFSYWSNSELSVLTIVPDVVPVLLWQNYQPTG